MNKKKKRYNRKEERAFIAVIVLVLVLAMIGLGSVIRFIVGGIRNAVTLHPAEPAEGVGRADTAQTEVVGTFLAPATAEDAETARMLDEYTEGDAPVPEWYRPEEPMSAEWFAAAEPETIPEPVPVPEEAPPAKPRRISLGDL